MIGGDGINDESNKTAPPPLDEITLRIGTTSLTILGWFMSAEAWNERMTRLAIIRTPVPGCHVRSTSDYNHVQCCIAN